MDLLKHETPPMPADSVLWFVFLLDPSSLEKHLNKKDADPTPTDLIVKFLTNGVPNPETGTRNKKNLALKILSLKVAAFLKWDMTILQNKLSPVMLRSLLNDLLYMVLQADPDPSTHSTLEFNNVSSQVLFSVVLFHRWVLRALVKQNTGINGNGSGNGNTSSLRALSGSVPNGMTQTDILSEDLPRMLEKQAADSVAVLQRALVAQLTVVSVPTFHTFQPLSEDSNDLNTDWDQCLQISVNEFRCQLHFDLGVYFIFRQENSMAREHFSVCTTLLEELSPNPAYCNVPRSQLDGYRVACGVVSPSQPSLLCQFHASAKQQYMGIVNILVLDNKTREIPMVLREHLELDIQGAVQSGKFTVARDLLLHVQCLNMARRLFSGLLICQDYAPRIKAAGTKGADIVVSVLKPVVAEAQTSPDHAESVACQQRVKAFISSLLTAANMASLVKAIQASPDLCSLFDSAEQERLFGRSVETKVPSLVTTNSWDVPDLGPRRNPRLESGALEQQLIQSYDPKEIRQLLSKLSTHPRSKDISKVNEKWELPIPVHSVIMSLPQGFLQDFCFILLAKAQELASVQEYSSALTMYAVVDEELKVASQNPHSIYKLTRLCSWEALIVEITQFIDEWPAHSSRINELSEACRSCLSARQAGEALIPRLEVIERCVVMLLNTPPSAAVGSNLDFLTKLDRHCGNVELAAAFAFACQDIIRHKGCRHVSRDAWDLVLPAFLNGATKRNSSGMPIHHTHRDSPVSSGGISTSILWAFFAQLREPTMVTLAISLLARIHNVLRDDSKFDINVDYVALWPSSISVPNSYGSRTVAEMMYQLLGQALRYSPSHVGWLKVLGDLNFVMGHHSAALKAYLEAAIAATDFFSQQLPKTQIDDQVIRRMIRCCSALQCHTQAAVLCQFLDEIDYTIAFKCLGETKGGSCSDAMDSYYGCVWDTTLLEYLVHLHTKRGETHRKQLAIQTIGLLELNSNNNEEIQREAANIRKSRFLRALAHQYVC